MVIVILWGVGQLSPPYEDEFRYDFKRKNNLPNKIVCWGLSIFLRYDFSIGNGSPVIISMLSSFAFQV